MQWPHSWHDMWRTFVVTTLLPQIARFIGPTWDPPGACRTQLGPMLAPWTLLSGLIWKGAVWLQWNHNCMWIFSVRRLQIDSIRVALNKQAFVCHICVTLSNVLQEIRGSVKVRETIQSKCISCLYGNIANYVIIIPQHNKVVGGGGGHYVRLSVLVLQNVIIWQFFFLNL